MKALHAGIVLTLVLIMAAGTASAAPLLFTPRATVTERYSDNIFLDHDNKKSDFITTPTVGFTAEIPGQSTGLSLSYDGGYNFYAEHATNDGWQHNALGNVYHNFTRDTRLDLNSYFLYAKEANNQDVVNQQGNVVAPGDFSSRQGLNTYYRDYSTARLMHQFGPENSTYAQFVYGFLHNKSDQFQDSQEISPSVGMTYWWTTWTGIELEGAYLRGLYDNAGQATNGEDDFQQGSGRARLNHRLAPNYGFFEQYQQIYRNYDGNQAGQAQTNGQLNQDYWVYAPSVGLFYQFDPTLTASIGLGYFYQQIQNADDQQGFFPTGDINKLWDYQSWSVRARGSAGIASQDFNAQNQGFTRYVQTDLLGRYNFTRQFFGDAELTYRYSDYINSQDDEVDHYFRGQAGFGYDVFRWMTLRLSYAFTKLTAVNSSTNDYEENSVMFTVTLQPDVPWKLWD